MATTASKPVKNRSAQTATGRIEARVLPEQKTLFERAAAMTNNQRERALLLDRASSGCMTLVV